MFDSLDEQMKKDEDRISSPQQRMLRWLLYLLAGIIVIGGVFLGVHTLNG